MEIMNNNYYPSVKICNNEIQEKTNNSLLERRFRYKDIVHQGPQYYQNFFICNQEKKLIDNKIIIRNEQLFTPIKNNISEDTILKNINTINNKCGMNVSINPYPFNNKVNKINDCLYGNNNNRCQNNILNNKMINQNWNKFSNIDRLPQNEINKLKYYEHPNTIPFMLNNVSVDKPNTNCYEYRKCYSIFNYNTKNN